MSRPALGLTKPHTGYQDSFPEVEHPPMTSWLHAMSSLRMSEAVSVLALFALMDRGNFIFAFYTMGMRTC